MLTTLPLFGERHHQVQILARRIESKCGIRIVVLRFGHVIALTYHSLLAQRYKKRVATRFVQEAVT